MAKARRKHDVKLLGVVRRKRAALMISTALCVTFVMVVSMPAQAQPAPNARPTGGVVTAGAAAISQTTNQTTINQSTNRAAVNWQSFDVGSQQAVQFNQPATSSVTLNRVVGPNPSQIAGRIDANGQVVLVNQSGVVFYKGSQVNTAGLMVSAAGISNQNFMAGKMVFDQPAAPNAQIVNQGNITIKQAGLAALVAPQVVNSGVIDAKLGHVVLAGASKATLDLYGDGMLSVDVTGSVTQAPNGATALVTNTGIVRADGGTVQLTARAVDGIVTNLVDAGGTISAASVGGKTGAIALNGIGGSIIIDGQVSATGNRPGTTGGDIVANATGNVVVTSKAHVDASGQAGGGTVAIGTTLARAKGGPSVKAKLTAANVLVQQGATIAASATASGNGGRVTILSTNNTIMDGAIVATGGSLGGDGGFAEISGTNLSMTGAIDLSAPTGAIGTLLLDPTDLTIKHSGSSNGSLDATLDSNDQIVYTDTSGGSDSVTDFEINSLNANILLQATNSITENVNAVVTLHNNRSLTLETQSGNITLNGSITASGTGNIIVLAGTTTSSGGQVVLGSGANLQTASGGGITLQADGGINLNSATLTSGSLDVSNITTGGLAQASGGTITAVTLQSANGVAGSADFAGTANAISAVGSIAVSGGDFTLVNTGSLNLAGKLTATNITVSSDTISASGSVGATTDLALAAGAGGISLNTGHILSGATVDLSATNGGVAQVSTGKITATTSLQSGSGVKGTVDLAGTSNAIAAIGSFAVSSGDFTLADTGNLTAAGKLTAANITLSSPTVTATGSVGATTTLALVAGGGGIALNTGHILSATTVDLSATGGGVTQAAGGTVSATVLQSTSNIAGGLSLVSTVNQIAKLGAIKVTSGNIAIKDAAALTIAGLVNAAAGNVYLESSNATGITFGSNQTVEAVPSGTIGLQTNALVNVGTTGATGVITAGSGGVFELSPDTANAVTLGASSGLSLANLLGITAGTLRIGAVTQGSGSPTIIANAISIAGAFGSSSTNLELDTTSSGAITQSAALTAATLTGTAGSGTLTTAGNAIATLGTFAVTNDFSLTDTGSLAVSGPVTAANVILSAATIGVSGSIGATTSLAVTTTTGALALTGSAILNGGTVNLASHTGIAETITAAITATSFTATAGAGSIVLNGTSNAVGTVTGLSASSGGVTLMVDPTTVLTGPITGDNLFFEVAHAGDTLQAGNATTGATLTATAAATPTITFVADNVTEGTAASTITAAHGVNVGTVEIAPFTSGRPISFGGTTAPVGTLQVDPTLVADISTGAGGGLLRIGNFTGGSITAGNISIDGAVNLGAVASALEVDSGGSITELASIALTVSTLTGTAASSVSLLGTGDSIGTLGSFAAGTGAFTLVDNGNAANLSVTGPVTGSNVTISDANTGTISVSGSIGATTSLGLSSGSGGIALNGGDVLTGATVDLSAATGGGVTQAAGGTISASRVLQSTSGVTGTVDLAGTANDIAAVGSFAVTTGDFTLVDNGNAGNLTVNGPLNATNVTIDNANTGTISVGGKIIAGTSLVLSSGSGGIALNSGEVLQGHTVDLSTTGGGVTQVAGGTITASTVLQSSANVVGAVALVGTNNTIAAIGPFTASGNIAVKDQQALTIAGLVESSGGNVYLQTASGGGITFGAATAIDSVSGGTIGLQTNALSGLGVAGAAVNAGATGTFELAPNTQGNAVTLGSASGLSLTNLTGITTGTLRVGAVTIPGSGLTTMTGSIAVAGAAFDGTGLTKLELDATTTGGGTGDVGQSTALLNIATLTGTAASYTLTDTSNTIGAIGPLSATGGNIAIKDATAMTIAGAVAATNGNVYLEDSAASGITFGAFAVSSQSGGLIGLQTNALVNLGTTGATGTLTAGAGGTFELSPDTANAVTLGAASGLSLSNLTGITAGIVRIGAVTQPGNGSPTTIANAISIAGVFGTSGTSLELDANGAVAQSAAVTAATLSGSATSYTLTTASNAISTLGPLAATGTIAINDASALTIGGAVGSTGGNVYLEDSAAGGITFGAFTVSSQSGGVIGLQTNALVNLGTASATGAANAGATGTFELSPDTAHAVTLGASSGLSLANLTGITAGTLRIGAVTQPGNGSATTIANAVSIAGAFGSGTVNLEIDATGAVGQSAAVTAAGLSGSATSYTLTTASNSISTLGPLTASGTIALRDATALTLGGTVHTTGGNVYLEDSAGGGIDLASFTVSSQSGGVIGLQTNALVHLGATGAINAGAAGTFEVAPDTANPVTLGSASGLSLTDLSSITAGTVRVGAVTQPGSVSPTVIANAISITGAFGNGTTNLELDTSGAITEAAVLTAQTLTGTAGSGTLTLSNVIATLGSFSTTNNFSLTDAGSLAVAGPVTAANVVLNAATISVGGSIGATTSLALVAGAGGIALNGGEVLSGATVDFSATNGGVTQVSTGTITATAVLQSTSGVTGTVDLAGTSNAIASVGSFQVNSGDFTLVDTGDLTAAGKLTATNISLSSPTITATGSVGATTDLVLAAGAGGIALNSGEVLSGATVDLSAGGNGVTQGASGTVTAGTLTSSGGITGTLSLISVSNQIGTVAGITVSIGNVVLIDGTNLTVSGALGGNSLFLDVVQAGDTLALGATAALTGTGAGRISLVADQITATTGASLSGAATVQLAPFSAATPLTLGATGGSGISVGATLLNGISIGAAGTLAIGRVTPVSGFGTAEADGITIGASVNLGSSTAGTLDLESTGGVSEAAAVALTVGTLTSNGGITGGAATLAGTSNAIGTLGGFAVTGNAFSLSDTGALSVNGAVSASNVTIGGSAGSTPTGITLTGIGSIAAPTVTLSSGASGIALNTGASLGQSGATVDLSSTGGINEVTGATITAATLQSSGGISGAAADLDGTANAIASVGSFAVSGADFTLMDTGDLTAAGKLTANNISLTSPTITATGSVGATSVLTVASGAGGIALNGGAVLTGPTIDLNGSTGGIALTGNASLGGSGALVDVTTTGGITEATTGTVTAATLRSTSGVTGTVDLAGTANAVASLGNFPVTGGDFTLVDTGSLAVPGTVTANNVTLSTNGANQISTTGSLGAGTVVAVTSGGGGIALNTGAVLTGPTIDLNGNGGPVTLAAGSQLGQTGDIVDVSTSGGGVNENVAATIIAATLRSTLGVTGTVDLVGTANTIASVGSFAVTSGDFTLMDTGDLIAAGKLTATNISLTSPTITATGSVGAIGVTGVLALNSGAGGIALNTGAVLTGPTIDLNGSSGGIALTGSASLGGSGALVDVTTTGGIAEAATGTVTAGTLQSTSGVTGTVDLAGTANAVANLGNFPVTGGDFTLVDTGSLAVPGIVTANNITLSTNGANQISATGSLGAGTVVAVTSGGGGIALNTGAVLTGPTIDLNGNGGSVTLAAGSRLGQTGDIVDVSTSAGGVNENVAATIIAATLRSTSGVTGTVDLAGTANTIVSVGSFAVTGGDFTLLDTGNLIAAGKLTANNISLTSATITATGSVGATAVGGVALLNATGGAIALNSGVLSGATVDLSATNGVTQLAGDVINATTVLQSTSGVTGTVDLVGTSNTIASVGSFAVTTGDFTLMDTGDLIAAGKLTATNISLTSPTITATGSVGAIGVTGVLTVASGAGGIALNGGAVLTGPTIDLNGSTGGIALTGNASLGGSGALVDVTTTGGITEATTGTVTAATLRSTSGVTGTVDLAGTANAVASLGNFPVTGGDFTLVDTGSLAVPGTVTANNITLSTNGANQISATGSLGAGTLVAVTSGSGGIALNTGAVLTGPTIDLNGNGGPVTLAAGSQLGQTGDIVDVSTSAGGVNENVAATIIAATLHSTLGVTGTVDLVGTANTIASVGSFAVTSGDFTLMDTGDLIAAGKLTATNISLTSPTITATGSVGAIGVTGVLAVTSGAGGIALNTGAVLTGPTIDLNGSSGGIALTGSASLGGSGALVDVTTTGGIAEAATGTVTAGTLQSTSGVTGTVDLAGTANAVANLGNFPVTGGDFTLVDTGSLAVPGTVTANNITLSTNGANQISATGSLGAGTLVAVTSGGGGIALNTGAVLTGPTIDLNGNGGPVTLAAGSRLGQTGDIVDVSTSAGGVNENVAATIIAATLRSTLGVTGTVDLAGSANAVASLANFGVTSGDFTLVDTGSLAVPGTVTANNITLSTNGANQISATGSLGAGTLVAVTSGSGGVALNGGAVLTGPTIDVNGNGGPVTLAAGAQLGQTGDIVDISTSAGGVNENVAATIIAASLRSTLGVTGTVDLAGSANAVASLANFVVTNGDFTLVDTGSLAVPGTVTANNITLSTNGANQISATGSLGGGTVVAVTSGSGGIALGAGAVVTGPTIDLNGNGGAIALTGNASVGTGTALIDLTTTAGGVSEASTSVLTAGTLQSAAGVKGSVALLGTANAVGNVGMFVVTLGDFTLIDTGTVVLRGPVGAGNVTVSATLGGSGVGVTGSVTANGTIAFTSGTGGVSLGNGAVVSAPTIDVNSGGAAFTMIGNASLGNAGALVDITTSGGGISELATSVITAATLQSTAGLTGNVNLLGTNNAIAKLAKFIVSSGSLDLVDTGSLVLGGPISATSITANTVGGGAITASGSVTSTGTLSLTSGTGGIGFGTGAVVSAPTINLNGGGGAIALTGNAALGGGSDIVDVTTIAGGMSEAVTSVINAATLLSGSGVTGNVSLLGATNAVASVAGFNVTTGNFTLVDTGSLGVSGPLSATNVTLSTTGAGTISASGPITGSGSVAVTSGTGGISLGTGAIVTAPTIELNGGGGAIALSSGAAVSGATLVDLTTTAGGVSETATSSIDTALLQSAAGVNGNVTLSGTANAVTSLGTFVVTGGSFTLVDTGSLAIAGPVSAANVTVSTSGAGAISASGSITATGATLALTSGAGGISLGGGAVLSAPTIDLNGSGGAIAMAGNMSATEVTASTSGGGAISASGSITAQSTLAMTSGTGGISLGAGAVLSAPAIDLTGGGGAIALTGNAVLGNGTGLVDLTTSGGGISEASASKVLAATLQSSNGVTGTATFAGTGNAIGTLGNFVVTTGNLSLADSTSLSVTGPVQAANVTLTGTGATSISVSGTLGGTAGGGTLSVTSGSGGIALTSGAVLDGSVITLNGNGGPITLGGNATVGGGATTVDLDTTAGGVTESASASMIAATLHSSTGVTGAVALAGSANAIGSLGLFAVTGGSFSLTDTGNLAFNGPVSATSVSASTNGSGAISVNTTVAATATPGGVLKLASGTGGIAVNTGGVLTGPTVDLSTTGGGITESNGGNIVATTLQSSGGVTGAVSLPVTSVGTVGTFIVAAGRGAFSMFDSVPVTIAATGRLSADSVSLEDHGNIIIAGALTDPANGTVTLISDTGSITEPNTGTLVAALLTGSSALGTDLSGAGYVNNVGTLGNFIANAGTFTLHDGANLLISGTVTAGTIIINDNNGTGQVTLASGAGFVTGGETRPSNGTILFGNLPTSTSGVGGAYLIVGNFVQNGSSFVTPLNGTAAILDIDASGNISFDAGTGLVAPATWLQLNLAGGQATGAIDVQELDISYVSASASAALTAEIDGFSGNAAAGRAFIVPEADANFRVNACPVHSINCVLLPTQTLPTASPLNDFFVGSMFSPADQGDLLLPIVSNEYMESLTAPGFGPTNPIQEDCDKDRSQPACKE